MAKFTGHTITPDSALGGKVIGRSVRCGNGGAFRRTPSVTGNQKVWTWSAWIKKWGQGGTNHLFSSQGSNNGISAIYFNNDNIHTYFDTTGANPYGAVNSREYRDPNSWMHIVWQVDALNTDQRIWINGQEESITSSNDPPNYAYSMNEAGKRNSFGESAYGGSHTNGIYFAEMHHSDGYKYDPSYYGYTDPQTGIWRPKKVTGISYGTNGFYLDFSDNSSAAALGKDRSGNGNDWTPNGSISVANDKNNDSSLDTPTNNFCTLNPVRRQNDNCNFDEGNLQASGSSTSYPGAVGNIALSSGKWYYEFQINTYTTPGADPMCGICQNDYVGGGADRITYRAGGAYITSTPSEPTDPDAYAVGDIIGVAIDLDDAAGKIRFYKNGSLQPILANGDLDDVKTDLQVSTVGGVYPYVQMYTNDVCTVNFGQRSFTYTPPSGHKKITVNANNSFLDNSTPSVIDPKKHFDTVTYTGPGSGTQNITSLGFQPDFVWIKARSVASYYINADSVRGAGKLLSSNASTAETDDSATQTAFQGFLKNGFTVGYNGAWYTNGGGSGSSATLVAWCWKAGGAAVTNNDGTIATQVSVNQDAGFSIVTYTGTNADATIGHGLGKVPAFVIIKNRDRSVEWIVKHHKLSTGKVLYLDIDSSEDTASGSNNGIINDLDNASTISLSRTGNSGNYNNVNYSGERFVAYCWSEIPGYSKFGKYTGNGNADGPFVYLGFRPAWVLYKCISVNKGYGLADSVRTPSNEIQKTLFPDSSGAEYSASGSGNHIQDFLSNGFKLRNTNNRYNQSGQTYVYMAFAEQPGGVTPFQTSSNAR